MKTLKYAIRFLSRSRSYTLINLLGLAFSLACCIILLRYIHREQTVDTHCVDRERIVVPIRDITVNTSISTTDYCDTTFIPDNQIVRRSYVVTRAKEPVKYNQQTYTTQVLLTDSEFLQMFNYPIVEGVAELSAPDHGIITQEYAQKLFGKESAIGKVLEYDNKNITVRAVIAQPSCKTTLHFDVLFSKNLEPRGNSSEFIQLLPGVDLNEINKISNVYRRIILPDGRQSPLNHRFKFVNMEDLYFEQGIRFNLSEIGFFTLGNSDYLNILFIVAILLLFVGILNFVNLYMVYMMKRSKEYGIKKVYGLQKFSLFIQIWSENVLLAFWALMVAWLIIEITQVPVARLMECQMNYTLFDLQLSLGFLILMPLVTSIYPYIRYQYMSPITSMRSIATNRQSVATRMSFLAIQYIVTFVLTVFSLYLNKHFQFLVNTPTGFRSERILEAEVIQDLYRISGPEDHWAHLAQIKQKLDECPDILSWTQANNILNYKSRKDTFYNGKDESVVIYTADADKSFFDLYNLEIMEGKLPETEGNFTDLQVILNQSAMKALGFKHLEEAFIRCETGMGTSILEDGSTIYYGTTLFPVTAVVKDFYPGHITEGISPMILCYNKNAGLLKNNILIHVAEGKEKAVVDYLKSAVREVYGNDEFNYTWLSDQVKAIYDEDRQIATIYTIFALIAITVSCLGLFGISLFDIRQRYREIAIRKVNGAGMKDLYRLLFRKYTIVLGISFFIAVPVAYYLIHTYTAGYVVKAPMGIGIFVIALMVVALISLGTLYWQIRKAANIDPAKTMKME